MDAPLLRDHLQSVELGDRLREATAVARMIDAADAQRGHGRIVDDEHALVVTVHFGDGIGQNRLIEHHLAAAPGRYRVDARLIELRRSPAEECETLARRE